MTTKSLELAKTPRSILIENTTSDVNIDSNTLYVDKSTNRVGVGKNTPTTELDVSGDVTATAFYGDGSNLTGISTTTTFAALTDTSVSGQATNTLIKFNGTNYVPTLATEDSSGNITVAGDYIVADEFIFNSALSPRRGFIYDGGANDVYYRTGGASSVNTVTFGDGGLLDHALTLNGHLETNTKIITPQIETGDSSALTVVNATNFNSDVTIQNDLTIDNDLTVNNDVIVSGNLTVQGTTTQVDSNVVNIGDAIITLNADETGAPSQNGGIEIERGISPNVQLIYNETTDKWQITPDGNNYYNILSTQDLGSGNGLDADTLDSLESTSFLRSDASDNYTSGTLTFDNGTTIAFGNTSGTAPFTVSSTTVVTNLNADLLDGQQGSYYTNWTNITNKPDPVITLAGDLSGSVTLTDLTSATLTATIAANSVALGTDTTGNYIATIAGTTNEIEVSGSGSETAAVTIGLPNDVTIGNNLTVTNTLFTPIIDTTDSSAITVTPEVFFESDVTIQNDLLVTNAVIADTFFGDGSNLTGISSAFVDLNDTNVNGQTTNTLIKYNGIAYVPTTATEDASGNFAATGSVASADGYLMSSQNLIKFNTNDTSSLAIGEGALASWTETTASWNNIAIGQYALNSLTTNGSNIAIGNDAQEFATGFFNTGIGRFSLQNNTSNRNTAVGDYTLSNSTSQYNNAFGYASLNSLTTGERNTAMGAWSQGSATGSYNVSTGYAALENVTGELNVSLGYFAGNDITTGIRNTIIGSYALDTGATTSSHNVAIGSSAMGDGAAGDYNTAVGRLAGRNIASSYNTVVGGQAGDTITTGSNLTVIGYNADPSSATATNEITLGNTNVTKLRVPGAGFEVTSGTAVADTAVQTPQIDTTDSSALTVVPPTNFNADVTVENSLTVSNDVNVGSHIDLAVGAYDRHALYQEGRMWYDTTHATINYWSDDPNVVHEIGLEEHQRVYNNTGSTILKGQPLYFSGNYTSGSKPAVPTVGLADATNVNTYNAQGIAAGDIPNNSYGYCLIAGQLFDVDTSALTAGTNFFVGLTPGAVQNTGPVYPNYPMCLGWVVKSDATSGILLVNQQNHSVPSFRVQTAAHIGDDLIVDGDLIVNGTTTSTSSANIGTGAAYIYLNSGDTIGEANTTFTGSGLDDAYFSGHYTGTTTTTYYVRIDSTGTPDTFEWSKDNFSTTEATGVAITGAAQTLDNGIEIDFGATTGHTSGDVWSGTAAPANVDTGFFSNRNTGTTGVGYTHMGLFWDVTDNKWKIIEEYDPEPAGSINTAHASYNEATLVADTFEAASGVFSTTLTLGGNTVLTTANEGTGNGLDADTVDGVEASSFLRSDAADTKTSGDLSFADNVKAVFGAGNDLEIYHDGSHSYIKDVGTGNLWIGSNGTYTALGNSNASEFYIKASNNGAVELYYDNSAKIATTSTGVTVTGTVVADGISLDDSEKIQLGTSNDLEIYHDGSHSYITDAGTGQLRLRSSAAMVFQNAAGTQGYATFNENGAVQLYYNGTVKFETASTGVDVTGNVTVSGQLEVSTIDTADSSAITIIPAATFNSDVTVENELKIRNGIENISGNLLLPASLGSADQVLTVSSDGTRAEWKASSGGGGGSGSLRLEEFPVVNNGSANVTLSQAFSLSQLDVYLNGARLKPTTDYTVSGTTLTFSNTLSTGDVVAVYIYDTSQVLSLVTGNWGSLNDVNVTGQATNTLNKFNGTAYVPALTTEDGSGNMTVTGTVTATSIQGDAREDIIELSTALAIALGF